MKFSFYILYFVIFSVIGWMIDSTFRSIQERRIVNSGYFQRLPVCPIYGFGAIILIIICKLSKDQELFVTILIATLAMIMVEYIGGIFCDKILHQRVWDYSHMKFNLHGHISLLQSFYWLLLVVVFYFFFLPHVLLFEKKFSGLLVSSSLMDIVVTSLFWCLVVIVTYIKRKKRKSGHVHT